MMRSMFAGVSGIKSHQMMMDVIGDNIANVNSTGFKANRTIFQDTLSQITRDGARATATSGSINPTQVGLGVRTNAVDAVITQGALQTTGRPTDVAIQGNGYFALRIDDSRSLAYSRAGSFNLDPNNHLVDPSGGILLGYQANQQGTFDQDFTATPPPAAAPLVVPPTADGTPGGAGLRTYSIGVDGTVNAVYADGTSKAVARVALASFENPAGLVRAGDGHLVEGLASGRAQVNAAGLGGTGVLSAGTLEMSNVDLSQEFTNMIIAQRGFQANSKVITTSDELLQELVNLKR